MHACMLACIPTYIVCNNLCFNALSGFVTFIVVDSHLVTHNCLKMKSTLIERVPD